MMSRVARRCGRWASGLALIAAVVAVASVAWAAGDDGYKCIFDGKSLEGWDGNPDFWRVEEGTIVGQTTKDKPTKGNTFLVWRKGKVADFELKLEFRMEGGNSGIQYRSFEEPEKWGKWVIGGYQADMDAGNAYTGCMYGERYRGMLCPRGQKVVIGNDHKPKQVGKTGEAQDLMKAIKNGEWNEFQVIAKGFEFTHKINGVVMAEVTDDDKAQRKSEGLLALQLHAGPPMKVQFRNIRLKELPASTAKAAKSADAPRPRVQCQFCAQEKAKKKVVFISGKKSHGYASHAHYAGNKLLAQLLEANVPQIETVVYRDGWPKDPKALDGADVIVIFSDGGGGHPIIPYLDKVEPLMKKGVGLVLLHYAVEVPKGKAGEKLLAWAGGYFEPFWSVNPFWTAEFKTFPEHPVARGLKPFTINDEWYYHMRFPEGMKNVTPILTAVPPDSTRERPDGPHSGNPTVRARKGMPEHVGWVIQREDGGRGFGFTGGHAHWNWACDSFRTVVLNAIVWCAGLEVPAGGVPSKTPTLKELEENQDYDQPKNFNRKQVEEMIQKWKK